MPICVEIEVSDDGQVMVGVDPEKAETGEPKGYMQPAASVDEALAKAKSMLDGAGQAPQEPMQAQPAPAAPAPQGQDPNAAAASAFNRIRGGA